MIKEISVAFVFTKYQYNILILTLEKLSIPNDKIVIFISEKAKKQGLKTTPFYKTYFYNENYESLKYRNETNKILNEYKILLAKYKINNILLRNFNSTLSRFLFSNFNYEKFYLLEEGVPSYLKKIGFLATPFGLKEKIKTFLVRFYFSKGLLRIMPFHKRKTIKVGFFNTMKPWLNVPYFNINLSKSILDKENIEKEENFNYKVIILDQPLWQVGLTKDQYLELYIKLIKYIFSLGYESKDIIIKAHPSTLNDDIQMISNKLQLETEIKTYTKSINIEELLIAKKLENIELYIGFFSWSLGLLDKNKNKNSKVEAFSDKNLENIASRSYELLEDLNIKIKRVI